MIRTLPPPALVAPLAPTPAAGQRAAPPARTGRLTRTLTLARPAPPARWVPPLRMACASCVRLAKRMTATISVTTARSGLTLHRALSRALTVYRSGWWTLTTIHRLLVTGRPVSRSKSVRAAMRTMTAPTPPRALPARLAQAAREGLRCVKPALQDERRMLTETVLVCAPIVHPVNSTLSPAESASVTSVRQAGTLRSSGARPRRTVFSAVPADTRKQGRNYVNHASLVVQTMTAMPPLRA